MQIIVNDIVTNYEILGSGPVVLLLHGWGDSSRTWNNISKDMMRDHQVVTLDLPGFGASAAPKTAWGLDNYANFIKDFLQKIEVSDTQIIIGHSNGGAIAIYALSEKVLSAKKLVLLASSGIRRSSKKKSGLAFAAKLAKIFIFWLPNKSKQKLQKKLYSFIGSDALVSPHMKGTFKQIVSQDVQKYAQNIDIPTLLIYGGKDSDTPLEYGEIFNNLIPNSKLHIVYESGHFVHMDAEHEVINEVRDFV